MAADEPSILPVEDAEISAFAKKAFEDYVAELTKVGEMYASLVQSAFKVR